MQTKLIKGLSQIQSKYDAFFIDLWGVVHNGIKLHAEAIKVLENINKLKKRAAKKKWSPEVAKAFEKTLNKLSRINPQIAEYSIQLNYLELMILVQKLKYIK